MNGIRHVTTNRGDWEAELRAALSISATGNAEADQTVAELRAWAGKNRDESKTLLLHGLPGEGIGEVAYQFAWHWLDRSRGPRARTSEVWLARQSDLNQMPAPEPGIDRLEIVDVRGAKPAGFEGPPAGCLRLMMCFDSAVNILPSGVDEQRPSGWFKEDAVARLTAFARATGMLLLPESAAAALDGLRVWTGRTKWTGRDRVLIELAEASWTEAVAQYGSSPNVARSFAEGAQRQLERQLRRDVDTAGESVKQLIEVCAPLVLPLLQNEADASAVLDFELVSGLLFARRSIDLKHTIEQFPHLLRALPAGPDGRQGLQAVTPLLWRLGPSPSTAGRLDPDLVDQMTMVATMRRSIAGARCLWSMDRSQEALDVVFDSQGPEEKARGLQALWAVHHADGQSHLARWESQVRAASLHRPDGGERGLLAMEAEAIGLLRRLWDNDAPSGGTGPVAELVRESPLGLFGAAVGAPGTTALPAPDATWCAVVAVGLERLADLPEPRRTLMLERLLSHRPVEALPAVLRVIASGRVPELTPALAGALMATTGSAARLLMNALHHLHRGSAECRPIESLAALLASPAGPELYMECVRLAADTRFRENAVQLILALLTAARTGEGIVSGVAAILAVADQAGGGPSQGQLRERVVRASVEAGASVSNEVARVLEAVWSDPMMALLPPTSLLQGLPEAIVTRSREKDPAGTWIAETMLPPDGTKRAQTDQQMRSWLAGGVDKSLARLTLFWWHHATLLRQRDAERGERLAEAVNHALAAAGLGAETFRPGVWREEQSASLNVKGSSEALELLQRAEQALAALDHLSAHELLVAINNREPSCATAWEQFAGLYLDLGKPGRALAKLDEAFAKNVPATPQMALLRATALVELKRAPEALTVLDSIRGGAGLPRHFRHQLMQLGARAAADAGAWLQAIAWETELARSRLPAEPPADLEKLAGWIRKVKEVAPGVASEEVLRRLIEQFCPRNSPTEVAVALSAGLDDVVDDVVARATRDGVGQRSGSLAAILRRHSRSVWADLAESVELMERGEHVAADALLAGTEGRIDARPEVALLRTRCALATAKRYRQQGIGHAAVEWVVRGRSRLEEAEWSGLGGSRMLRLRVEFAVLSILTGLTEPDDLGSRILMTQAALRFLAIRFPNDDELRAMLFDVVIADLKRALEAAFRNDDSVVELMDLSRKRLRELVDVDAMAMNPTLNFEARLADAFVETIETAHDSRVALAPAAISYFEGLVKEAHGRNARLSSPERELQDGELAWRECRLWRHLANEGKAAVAAGNALSSWLSAQAGLTQSNMHQRQQQRVGIDLNFKIRRATDLVRADGGALPA
jgi:hypothetical protein